MYLMHELMTVRRMRRLQLALLDAFEFILSFLPFVGRCERHAAQPKLLAPTGGDAQASFLLGRGAFGASAGPIRFEFSRDRFLHCVKPIVALVLIVSPRRSRPRERGWMACIPLRVMLTW